MNKLGLAVLLSTTLCLSGFAQTAKKPAPLSCPICHMALSAKKTTANPTAIKLTKGGKTYYCCPKCTMPASMLVKAKPVKAKA